VLASACGRPLPQTLEIEDVVAELTPGTDVGPDARWGRLDPGDALRADGARDSVIPTPGRAVTWQVVVPDDGALHVGFGVEGDGHRDDARSGLRFVVAVDGREVLARDVDPAERRRDRRWFDEHVTLEAWRGRRVAVTFTVTPTEPGATLAGTPGWSRIRVVRRTTVTRQPADPTKPNLIVVVVDTLRADAVGPRDGRPSATPKLDAFGARGVVFTQAVSQSSWTLESVSSLMTGLHSRTHGARARHAPGKEEAAWGVLGDPVVTWAEAAARAGITSVGVSANPLVSRGTNLAQGFETFEELRWDPEGHAWPTADAVNDAFFRWLRRVKDDRFVAYLHYMEPHDPYTPPVAPPAAPGVRPVVARGWILDLATQINWSHAPGLSADELAHLRARYRGEVTVWDEAFGRRLDGLASDGLRDRTVVVVTADHGEEFQEHGRLTHGSHLYEETVRVPLAIAGPGVPAGHRDDPVQGIDLYPTVVHVLGLPPPADLPGKDLLSAPDEPRPAVLETSSGIGPDGGPLDLVAVRTPGWKLVETPALGRRELYDLANDAAEQRDRSGAAELAALTEVLAAWRARTPSSLASAGAPDLADRLRALGYAR